MSGLSDADRQRAQDLIRKIKYSTGKERTDALEGIFEMAKEDKNKLALCQPGLGLIDALLHTLRLPDDSYATSWAVSCVGRLSASVKQNKEYLSSPEVGVVPELVRLITRANCKDNVYVFFGNCILNSVTVPYLLSESLGLVDAARREMEANPDYKFVYTFFANAVTIMSNKYCAYFIRMRVHELIVNRLVQAGPDPSRWPDRNTGCVYRSMGFVTSFSTLPDGRRAIRDLQRKEFFLAFLQTKEKERMQASIIISNLYGRDEGDTTTKSLLQTYPDILQLLVNLLAAILDYNSESKEVKDYRGMGLAFGVTKMRDASSTLRCLSISDGNKTLMLKHPTFMTHVLRAIQLFIDDANECGAVYQGFQSYAGGGGKDFESIENFTELLLQLSFYYEDDSQLQREFNKPEYQLPYRLKCLLNLPEHRQFPFEARQYTLQLLNRLEPNTIVQQDYTQRTLYRSTSTSIETPQHIMVSYAWGPHKQQVINLTNRLKGLGYDVWRDEEGSSLVPPMHGDIVATMAEAIQNSYLIVVCCSREYKESTNCRAEAKYAQARQQSHNLRIVYVMLDEHYHTRSTPQVIDGWLSYMVGNQQWYPLWEEDQIESTADAVAALAGQHGKLEINQSLLTNPVTGTVDNPEPRTITNPVFTFPTPSSDVLNTNPYFPPASPLPNSSNNVFGSTFTFGAPSSSPFTFGSPSALPNPAPVSSPKPAVAVTLKDYEVAWGIINDPRKATNAEAIEALKEDIGLYEADELQFLEIEQLNEIASYLKQIPNKKFKFVLGLP
eukprot:gene9076-9830_t